MVQPRWITRIWGMRKDREDKDMTSVVVCGGKRPDLRIEKGRSDRGTRRYWYRRTWRSSGNAALTSVGMNSVGKARSRSLSSVKVEREVFTVAMVRDGRHRETRQHFNLNAPCQAHTRHNQTKLCTCGPQTGSSSCYKIRYFRK